MLKRITSPKTETFYTQSLSLEYLDQHYRQEWEYLAAQCLESNIFYTPSFLMALRHHILPNANITILASWRKAERTAPELIGLFPFLQQKVLWGRPVNLLQSLIHPYITATTPLIHKDHAQQAIICFLDRLEENQNYNAINMTSLPTDGAFFKVLQTELAFRDRPITTLGQYHRAALSSDLSGNSYLSRASKSRRRDIRKRTQQLASLGEIGHLCLSKAEELDQALTLFLDLEASGWKGKKRTALKSSPKSQAFAHYALKPTQNNTSCRYDFLTLDGQVIAGTLTLIHGDRAWTYKSAYNEDYARYAPSILAYAALTKKLLAQENIVLVDSASFPGNVIESLWQERWVISDILFATGEHVSQNHITWLSRSHNLYFQMRNHVKELAITAKKKIKQIVAR